MKHYQILQLREEYSNVRCAMFMSLEHIKKCNILLCRGMYKVVYEGDISDKDTTPNILDYLYKRFNLFHPANFKGRSMSVSDVVKLDEDYWYCDSMGFKKIELK